MVFFKNRKRLKERMSSLEKSNSEYNSKTYKLEQGLYSTQNQLNQLYRILWDYNHIVITHSEEEKNALVQTGFVVIGESVYECFENFHDGFDVVQRRYFILKPQHVEKK